MTSVGLCVELVWMLDLSKIPVSEGTKSLAHAKGGCRQAAGDKVII